MIRRNRILVYQSKHLRGAVMATGTHAGPHILGLSKTHTNFAFQALGRLNDLSVVSKDEFFLDQANTIRLFHGHLLSSHEILYSQIQTRLYRAASWRLSRIHHQVSQFLLWKLQQTWSDRFHNEERDPRILECYISKFRSGTERGPSKPS